MKEYNIEIVGACGVGKSSFTIRLVQGIFVKNYDPTRQDTYRKRIVQQITDHSQITYQVNLLDTVGVNEKEKDNAEYEDTSYQFGQGFVVMYDIANEQSFEDAKEVLKQIVTVKKDKKVPIMLVGNKMDLEEERQVLRTTGLEFTDCMSNVGFMETSAKDNKHVLECIHDLVKTIDKRTNGVVGKDADGGCVIS